MTDNELSTLGRGITIAASVMEAYGNCLDPGLYVRKT